MSYVAARIRAIPSWQITLGLALLALGFLIAAQLAAEGPRIRYTTQERSPLVEAALSQQKQQRDLKTRIVALRASIQQIEEQDTGAAARTKGLNARLEEARIAAGLIQLEGTGIVLKLEDSTQPVPADGNAADYLVTAADLRTAVAELWQALKEDYPKLAPIETRLLYAVNQNYVKPDHALKDRDEVVFIPPVSGGR